MIVEDGAFLGSRAIVTEGVRIGGEAVLAANVSLTRSVPVIDVTGPEPVEYRGEVPPRAVVVPGTRPKEFPAGTYQLDCALIIGYREESHDQRLSLNDVAARVRNRDVRLFTRDYPCKGCGRADQRRPAVVQPDGQVAAGEGDDDLAVAVRRRRHRDGARAGRLRLPHASLPDPRRHMARRVDARDLDVRALREARMRLEPRADLGQARRGRPRRPRAGCRRRPA